MQSLPVSPQLLHAHAAVARGATSWVAPGRTQAGRPSLAAHELVLVVSNPPVNVSQARERPQEIARHKRELDSAFLSQPLVLVNNLGMAFGYRASLGRVMGGNVVAAPETRRGCTSCW